MKGRQGEVVSIYTRRLSRQILGLIMILLRGPLLVALSACRLFKFNCIFTVYPGSQKDIDGYLPTGFKWAKHLASGKPFVAGVITTGNGLGRGLVLAVPNTVEQFKTDRKLVGNIMKRLKLTKTVTGAKTIAVAGQGPRFFKSHFPYEQPFVYGLRGRVFSVVETVERVAESGTLHPRQVKIPGILVDYVVVARPENHCQTFACQYNPAFSSELIVALGDLPIMPLDERKIIARRAAFELCDGEVVNLGIGMPEGVAAVAAEEGLLDRITLTTEPGTIGGVPAGGLNFGTSTNMQALIDQPYQFDFYDGGGLDVAFLGLAQADRHGNLNVSKFGTRLAGAGGFINISQNARKVVFVGTFMVGDTSLRTGDGELHIEQDGRACKFVEDVEHITFSGRNGLESDQQVLFVTERAVFRLIPQGLELIEIAPGVDLEREVLAKMIFRPSIRSPLALMDARIFRDAPMGLADCSQTA